MASTLGKDLANLKTSLEGLAEAVVAQMRALQLAAPLHDVEALRAIVARDQHIDDLELALAKMGRWFLEFRPPLGPNFRYVLGALDIGRNLERIGDCIEYVARHIADSGAKLEREFPAAWSMLQAQLTASGALLTETESSWLASDVERAKAILIADHAVDALQQRIMTLAIDSVRNGVDVELGLETVLIANKLQALGHVVAHTAEVIVFILSARQMRHLEPKRPLEIPSAG